MCIKARNRATERQPCTESCLSVVVAAQSLWLRRRLQRTAGGATSLLYLSSCFSPLPLISVSLLLFLSFLQAVSYCALLLCPSGALFMLHCHWQVCVHGCVPITDQVTVHFWSKRSFSSVSPHCYSLYNIFF